MEPGTVLYEMERADPVNGMTVFPVIVAFFGLLFLLQFILRERKFRHLFIAFILIVLGSTHFLMNWSRTAEQIRAHDRYRAGKYGVVQGRVESFVPSTRGLSQAQADRAKLKYSYREKFVISGVEFSYDSVSYLGYSQTMLNGGAIRPERCLRLFYLPAGGIPGQGCEYHVIARVELLDDVVCDRKAGKIPSVPAAVRKKESVPGMKETAVKDGPKKVMPGKTAAEKKDADTAWVTHVIDRTPTAGQLVFFATGAGLMFWALALFVNFLMMGDAVKKKERDFEALLPGNRNVFGTVWKYRQLYPDGKLGRYRIVITVLMLLWMTGGFVLSIALEW